MRAANGKKACHFKTIVDTIYFFSLEGNDNKREARNEGEINTTPAKVINHINCCVWLVAGQKSWERLCLM